MYIDEGLRRIIDSGGSIDDIKNYAVDRGMVTLSSAARELALSGITSFDEVIRIGYSIDQEE